MILSRDQMIDAEHAAFTRGVQAADLMETAGREMAAMVKQFHPKPGTCCVFAGKGHNGGDVLVAARYLASTGWTVRIEHLFPASDLAPLTATQLSKLINIPTLGNQSSSPLVVLDGLLGIGSSGDPREPIASAIRKINLLRAEQAAWVLAADIPSGLDTDSGIPGEPCVRADATITMGFFKSGLVADAATEYVGRLAVASLPEIMPPHAADPAVVSRPATLRAWLPPRNFDIHKGRCGRVAVIAGSIGYIGAARLCSAAAVFGGAGLVTVFVSPEIYPILAGCAIPEVMVSPIESFTDILKNHWDAIAVGPGLGIERKQQILDLLQKAEVPCVVDADALNALAGHGELLATPPAPRLLTPHPGEMERLSPCNNRSRRAWMQDFVDQYPVTLLLKGARTIIGEKGLPPVFNSTGNPGMASGGMGDVLTGICTALIAQGKSTREAAILGAWLCGRAAERAIIHGASQESLCAGDIMTFMGSACNDLRAACL